MLAMARDGAETMDETDDGRPKAARMRTCIATRTLCPIEDLVRFVLSPDGAVVPDLKLCLPGRGVWVGASAHTLRDALKKRAFSRGFKRDVRVDGALVDLVDALLLTRAREALSLANKAGDVVTGFAKLESALSTRTSLLLHASEAAADGAGKLDRRMRAIRGKRALIVNVLSGPEMDLALGRSNVIHAAVSDGPAGLAAAEKFRALVRFRSGGMEDECPGGAGADSAKEVGTDLDD